MIFPSSLDSPAKAASQALKGLQQLLQGQHNEIQRQRRESEEKQPSVGGGFNANQQMVSFNYCF